MRILIISIFILINFTTFGVLKAIAQDNSKISSGEALGQIFDLSIGNEKRESYLVKDVIAKAQAENSSQAQKEAIIIAHREAFLTLLQRLEIDEVFSDDFSDSEIKRLVKSQQVLDEKITYNSYFAILNIEFSTEYVSFSLNKKNINKDSVKLINYLTLPVLRFDDRAFLFEDSNRWRKALSKAIQKDAEANFLVLPYGDEKDQELLAIETVNLGEFGEFSEIVKKYDTNLPLVIYFDLDRKQDRVDVLIRVISRFQKRVSKLSFTNISGIEFEALMDKVAIRVVDYLKSKRTQKISEKSDQVNQDKLELVINISNLQDLIATKRRLEPIKKDMDFDISSIDKDQIKIKINEKINFDDLIEVFKRYGFEVTQDEGIYYLNDN